MTREAKTIVVASRNAGKIREFKRIFHDCGLYLDRQFLSAADVGLPDVEETGLTFKENAALKALACAKHCGLLCLGEDSGLEVDVLGGAPGVNSHRFSSTGLDEDNNELLLRLLVGVPWEKRTCRYKSAIALADPNGLAAQSIGSVEGIIHVGLRGKNGFGYDPLFFALELGKTFGEASNSEKDEISHRRRALQGLISMMG